MWIGTSGPASFATARMASCSHLRGRDSSHVAWSRGSASAAPPARGASAQAGAAAHTTSSGTKNRTAGRGPAAEANGAREFAARRA